MPSTLIASAPSTRSKEQPTRQPIIPTQLPTAESSCFSSAPFPPQLPVDSGSQRFSAILGLNTDTNRSTHTEGASLCPPRLASSRLTSNALNPPQLSRGACWLARFQPAALPPPPSVIFLSPPAVIPTFRMAAQLGSPGNRRTLSLGFACKAGI
ncbi:hypothetical protein AOQ84DRAFT_415981 [Glonium stellatum]|uniref:Uncharacterized protein n=1 Tax=Glonium stellatum TaxID=574774 RepID=A0A8E2ETV8_9PEZI|nr:hypothetical protein AOQ84DRAFT_415981 [Glonium stellatum]